MCWEEETTNDLLLELVKVCAMTRLICGLLER